MSRHPNSDKYLPGGEWCIVTEAAWQVGVSAKTIYRWIKSQAIRSQKKHGVQWVNIDEVRDYNARRLAEKNPLVGPTIDDPARDDLSLMDPADLSGTQMLATHVKETANVVANRMSQDHERRIGDQKARMDRVAESAKKIAADAKAIGVKPGPEGTPPPSITHAGYVDWALEQMGLRMSKLEDARKRLDEMRQAADDLEEWIGKEENEVATAYESLEAVEKLHRFLTKE